MGQTIFPASFQDTVLKNRNDLYCRDIWRVLIFFKTANVIQVVKKAHYHDVLRTIDLYLCCSELARLLKICVHTKSV